MANTCLIYHRSTLTIQRSTFLYRPRKSLRILNPMLKATSTNKSELASGLEIICYSGSISCFLISVSYEYHEIGNDWWNQILFFQKSQNGSPQADLRLHTDFVWPNSTVIFVCFIWITGCQHENNRKFDTNTRFLSFLKKSDLATLDIYCHIVTTGWIWAVPPPKICKLTS